MTIKEINGRPTCTRCGYEWSAMLGDDEWPDACGCETNESDPADFYDVAEEAEIAKGEVDFDPAWEWDEEAQYCTDNNI